jgi:hypothetical protein
VAPAGHPIPAEVPEVGHSLEREPSLSRDDRASPSVRGDRYVPVLTAQIGESGGSAIRPDGHRMGVIDGLGGRTDRDVHARVATGKLPMDDKIRSVSFQDGSGHGGGHPDTDAI